MFSAGVLRDLGQEGASFQRRTTSDQGGPATVEHRHPLRNDNEGVSRSVQPLPRLGRRKATSGRERATVEVPVHCVQAGLRAMSRSQVLSIVAMRGMRELGTPGVQLRSPGRAVVCFSLSDLGSPEGGGGFRLPVWKE